MIKTFITKAIYITQAYVNHSKATSLVVYVNYYYPALGALNISFN